MRRNYKRMALPFAAAFLLFSGAANAQCPAINCPGNMVVNSDPNSCSAVVSFTAPVGTDPCASGSATFGYTGSIVTWTVPAGVTTIHIQAKGAEGGRNTTSSIAPGLGADMSGDFTVTPGQQLKILVGQQPTATAGNGGGGGTFVTDASNNPLIVAGGGGGSAGTTDSPAKHGQVGTTGGTGAAGGGAGGTAGNGGSIGASGFQSGAGGGLLTNGVNGWTTGTGGFAFVNGGSGGTTNAPANGGFGGGGSGSSYVVGGGGGGYSGGGSGGNSTAGVGGGGGSFNAGTNQVNVGGANSGNGSVVITYSNGSVVTTTQTAGLPSGSSFPLGTTTQTFLADDGNGNTATCSFTITVNDAGAPTIVAPADITVNSDSGVCGAVVNFTAPVGVDACSSATTALTAGLASGSFFPVGTTVETFTVTDGAGNTASASFNIIVNDNEAPYFMPMADIVVGNDIGNCSAVVNFNSPAGLDNCSGVTTVQTAGLASGSSFPLGTTTQTYQATDAAGNSTTFSFNITVNDSEAPVMATPVDITSSNDQGQCGAVVNFTPPAGTDLCSGATTVQTGGLPSGALFPMGVTTETFVSTDGAGNSTTVSFNVTVIDTEVPQVSCPGDVTSCSGAIAGLVLMNYSDNCSVASVGYQLSGATSGSGGGNDASGNFNLGLTTVTFTVWDAFGNNSSCSFNVDVTGTPAVTAAAASTSACTTDAPVALTGTPAGGTWTGTGVTGNTFSPSTAGTGTFVLTYSYTDISGCSASDSLTMTVSGCVGMADLSLSNGISVFPNPNNGLFSINASAELGDLTIEIMDLQGRTVYRSAESNVHAGFVKQVSLEEMPSGVYMLRLTSGGQQRTEQLILQR